MGTRVVNKDILDDLFHESTNLREALPKIEHFGITFYCLEAINSVRHMVESSPSRDKFWGEFTPYYMTFKENLSRSIRDYLVVASFGEARHASFNADVLSRMRIQWGPSIEKVRDRCGQYGRAIAFDPNTVAIICQTIFEFGWHGLPGGHGGGVGGPRWQGIAEWAMMWKKMPNELFIDHVFDLEHNSGCVFGKPVMFLCDRDFFKRFLDLKAKCPSALHTIGQFKSFYKDYRSVINIDSSSKAFIHRAVTLGIVEANEDTGAILSFEETNKDIPIVDWGMGEPKIVIEIQDEKNLAIAIKKYPHCILMKKKEKPEAKENQDVLIPKPEASLYGCHKTESGAIVFVPTQKEARLL
ncbi:MAG: hypothetical protein L0Y56_05510 [Nitrospira sp.]|nr:hypothetical protein [Nitrospira sp.]